LAKARVEELSGVELALRSLKNTSKPSPGWAGRRGMNGERAPGVNRQTAGNLERQRRPQSGAVCKVQYGSKPYRRMIALPHPTEAKR